MDKRNPPKSENPQRASNWAQWEEKLPFKRKKHLIKETLNASKKTFQGHTTPSVYELLPSTCAFWSSLVLENPTVNSKT